jgi:hypothetical protein
MLIYCSRLTQVMQERRGKSTKKVKGMKKRREGRIHEKMGSYYLYLVILKVQPCRF